MMLYRTAGATDIVTAPFFFPPPPPPAMEYLWFCFPPLLSLSTSLLGRILFQNVSPYFVQKHTLYEKYLPEGKLLTAKVLG